MQIVAVFTGRGHDVLTEDGPRDRKVALVRNLLDGVDSGRVRAFAVIGAGVLGLGEEAELVEALDPSPR
jgi:hypothetical protein